MIMTTDEIRDEPFAELEYNGQMAYMYNLSFYSDSKDLEQNLNLLALYRNEKENEYYPLEQFRKLHRVKLGLPQIEIRVLQNIKFPNDIIY